MNATASERENPFVGPREIREGQPFFGREREVRNLYDLLLPDRIVLMYSPSGAGKTSLIHAGLIPKAREDFSVLPVLRVNRAPPRGSLGSPGLNRYLYSLRHCLEGVVPATGARTETDPVSLEALFAGLPETPQLLIFDQFEEILTQDPTDIDAKREIFQHVGKALKNPLLWALFSMREDYLAALDPYRFTLPNLLQTRFRLDLLSRDSAREVIVKTAKVSGVEFSDTAADQLVRDLSQVQVQRLDGSGFEPKPGPFVEPVQLQVVCRGLWEKLGQGVQVIDEALLTESIGSVDQSLEAYYAAEVWSAAQKTGVPERAIRDWFDETLITRSGVRGQAEMGTETRAGLTAEAVGELENAYLVRRDTRRGITWFELAHDRLIEPVRRNNEDWFRKNLHPFQIQAGLWAKEEHEDRRSALLLSDQALLQAEEWAAAHPDEVKKEERDLLEASRAVYERALEQRELAEREQELESEKMRTEAAQRLAETQAQATRRFRTLAYFLIVVLLLAVLLAGVAYQQGTEARAAATQANQQVMRYQSAEVASQALSARELSPRNRLLLAVEAAELATDSGQPEPPILRQAFYDLLTQAGSLDLAGHEGPVRAVATDPTGRWLATGSDDQTVRVWDLNAANPADNPAIFTALSGEVATLEFSPDGRWLSAGGLDGSIALWPLVPEPQAVSAVILSGYSGARQALAFSPDGRRLATGGADAAVRLWNLLDPDPASLPAILRGGASEFRALAFSPDGTRLAAGNTEGVLRLWNMSERTVRAEALELAGHQGAINILAFTPDGNRLVTAGEDASIRIWDLRATDPAAGVLVIDGLPGPVDRMAFTPDGRWLATGSPDGSTVLWHLSTPDPAASGLALNESFGPVTALAFSPDGRWLVTGGTDGAAALWDLTSSNPAANALRLTGHAGEIQAAAFTPDGRWLFTGSGDNLVKRWNLAPGLAALEGHQGSILAAAFQEQRDGLKLVTASDDATAGFWTAAPGRQAPKFTALTGLEGTVYAMAFSREGLQLAAGGDDNNARVWMAAEGSPSQAPVVLAGHEGWVLAVAFSPDGRRLATGSGDGSARVWDLETGQEQAHLQHEAPVLAVAFSPDGGRLATGSDDGIVRLWELNGDGSSPEPRQPGRHTDSVLVVAFSPNGRRLATGGADGTVQLWDLSDPGATPPAVVLAVENRVTGLAFSPDGRWLAIGSSDATARLWDLSAADLVTSAIKLSGHQDWIYALAFSPDGRWLVTGGADRTARLWPLLLDDLTDLACQGAGGEPAAEEWESVFPGRDLPEACRLAR